MFQLDALALGGIDEIRRQVTPIELHAFNNIQLILKARTFFDRNHAFLADLAHRVGNDLADRLIRIGRDRANLGNRLAVLTGLGQLFEFGHDRGRGLVDAALQIHRIHAGGNRLQADFQNRLGKHSRRCRAVTGDIGGL